MVYDQDSSLFTPDHSLVQTLGVRRGEGASELAYAVCSLLGPGTVGIVASYNAYALDSGLLVGYYDDRVFYFWNYTVALLVAGLLSVLYILCMVLALLLERRSSRKVIYHLLQEISGSVQPAAAKDNGFLSETQVRMPTRITPLDSDKALH